MIYFLKKLNWKKNYFLISKKLAIKLHLITAISARKIAKNDSKRKEKLVNNSCRVFVIPDKRTLFIFENNKHIEK